MLDKISGLGWLALSALALSPLVLMCLAGAILCTAALVAD